MDRCPQLSQRQWRRGLAIACDRLKKKNPDHKVWGLASLLFLGGRINKRNVVGELEIVERQTGGRYG